MSDTTNDVLEELRNEFDTKCYESLLRRCDELDEAKQYIRQMNDLIKDEMFINIGSIGVLLKQKVDEMSSLIKDMLKRHYGMLKVKENDMRLRLDEYIKTSAYDHDARNSLIDEIVNELHTLKNTKIYPTFMYSIKNLDKLEEAIKSLELHLEENAYESMGCNLFQEKFGPISQSIHVNATLPSSITTSISENGTFWLQFSPKTQINHFIDELNKQIRSMRINDDSYETFDECDQVPVLNMRCFCRETRSKKWLRARFESTVEENTLKVRYLDTGLSESNVSLDCLLPWREFDLNKVAFQALQCTILLDNSYDKQFTYDAKFLFKDLTLNQSIKCELIDYDEQKALWKVRLITEEGLCINDRILEQNNESLKEKSSFKSEDIRLKSGDNSHTNITSNFSILNLNSFNAQSTECDQTLEETSIATTTTTTDNILVKSSTSNLNDDNLLLDSTHNLGQFSAHVSAYIDKHFESHLLPLDEHQMPPIVASVTSLNQGIILHVNDSDQEPDEDDRLQVPYQREGVCHVIPELSKTGIFWINPVVDKQIHMQMREYCTIIKNFIEKTLFKSYDDLHIVPKVNKKCFVYLDKNPIQEDKYVRGLIEEVNEQREECKIRFVDSGGYIIKSFDKVYPHRRLHEIKYQSRAIRCCLTHDDSLLYFPEAIKQFHQSTDLVSCNYRLIERLQRDGARLWLCELSTQSIKSINRQILNLQHQKLKHFNVKKSNSTTFEDRKKSNLRDHFKNSSRKRSKSADSRLERVVKEADQDKIPIDQEEKSNRSLSDINNNQIPILLSLEKQAIVKQESNSPRKRYKNKKKSNDSCRTDGQKLNNNDRRNDDNDPSGDNFKPNHNNSGCYGRDGTRQSKNSHSNNRPNNSRNAHNYGKTNLINILCKYHTQSYLVACPEEDDECYDENEEDYNEVFIDEDDKFQLLSKYEKRLKHENLSDIVKTLDKAVKKREEREIKRLHVEIPENVLPSLFEEQVGPVRPHNYHLVYEPLLVRETRQSNLEDTLHDMSDVFYDPSLLNDLKRHKYIEIRSNDEDGDNEPHDSNQASPSIIPSIQKSISKRNASTSKSQSKDFKNFTVAVFVDSIEGVKNNLITSSTSASSSSRSSNESIKQIDAMYEQPSHEFDINHLKVINEISQLRRESFNVETASLKEFEYFESHLKTHETRLQAHMNNYNRHNLSTITELSGESGSGSNATNKKTQSLLKKVVLKSSQSTSTSNNKQIFKNEETDDDDVWSDSNERPLVPNALENTSPLVLAKLNNQSKSMPILLLPPPPPPTIVPVPVTPPQLIRTLIDTESSSSKLTVVRTSPENCSYDLLKHNRLSLNPSQRVVQKPPVCEIDTLREDEEVMSKRRALEEFKRQLRVQRQQAMQKLPSSGSMDKMSSVTTLGISSATEDSLFNSNFIITPIINDTLSPPMTPLDQIYQQQQQQNAIERSKLLKTSQHSPQFPSPPTLVNQNETPTLTSLPPPPLPTPPLPCTPYPQQTPKIQTKFPQIINIETARQELKKTIYYDKFIKQAQTNRSQLDQQNYTHDESIGNFSLYGLDSNTDEDRLSKLKSSQVHPSESQIIAEEVDNNEACNSTHVFPPPPSEFQNQPSEIKVSQATFKITNSHAQNRYQSSLIIKTAPSFIDTKIDHLTEFQIPRIELNYEFNCLIHGIIDENGCFWCEIVFEKEIEDKYDELFRLFRTNNNRLPVNKSPQTLYEGKFVSAFYKNEWYRGQVLSLIDFEYFNRQQELCSFVKVKFIDLGLIRILDRQDEIRDVDARFFKAPSRALFVSIRQHENVTFDREMKKLFTRLIYKKMVRARVTELGVNGEAHKIILGCDSPKGCINVYLFIISIYARSVYEDYKYQKRRVLTTERISRQSNTNAVHHTDMFRLDTLNEASFDTLQEYDDNDADDDDYTTEYPVDDTSNEERRVATYTPSYNQLNKHHGVDGDFGLDWTPVRDLSINKINTAQVDHARRIRIYQEQKPIEFDMLNNQVELPRGDDDYRQNLNARQALTSDTDSSIQQNKCCPLNPLKWSPCGSKKAIHANRQQQQQRQHNVITTTESSSRNKKVQFQLK